MSDPADKPCLKRINHENVSRFESATTWCTQPDGHVGQCSGPLPSVIEHNSFKPRSAKK